MKRPHIDISPDDGLEWEGGGYVHRVRSQPSAPMPTSIESDPLAAYACILEQAKCGDFSNIERLFDVREATQVSDTRLSFLSGILLGDAGSPRAYDRLLDEIRADPNDYEVVINACDALSMRGRLADVPVMLLGYRNTVYARDAEIIPVFISDVLDPEPGRIGEGTTEEEFDEYAQIVMTRYEALRTGFGTDDILVLKGERFSPRNLCKQIKDRVREPYFDLGLRRRFEAMSGYDCKVAFKGGRLKPLTLVELTERFLAEYGGKIDLDANTRYFFGHRLP